MFSRSLSYCEVALGRQMLTLNLKLSPALLPGHYSLSLTSQIGSSNTRHCLSLQGRMGTSRFRDLSPWDLSQFRQQQKRSPLQYCQKPNNTQMLEMEDTSEYR